MREIKFRGKRTDNGKWVYGDLSHRDWFSSNCGNNGINLYIYPYNDVITPNTERYEVMSKSVGQFICGYGYEGEYENRYDNMVELYENDIVEAWSEGVKGTFVIKLRQEAQPTFMLYPAYQSNKMWSIHFSKINDVYYDDLKKIGNIFDNPELLNN